MYMAVRVLDVTNDLFYAQILRSSYAATDFFSNLWEQDVFALIVSTIEFLFV